MIKWCLSNCLLVIISFLVLADPMIALSREDTAYISLKRVGVSRHQADAYVVKKDECLFNIVRKKYAVSKREVYRILELVKHFNPQLKDLNVIYPGQELLLPKKRSSETVSTTGAANQVSGVLPDEKRGGIILKYVVKRGDNVSGIIHKKFNVSPWKIYRMLERVRHLNPKIRNLDRIYPGQTLLLPRTAHDEEPVPDGQREMEQDVITIPEYKILPVISHIAGRMYGMIITDGSYCIPVPPSGEVKIDCSRVPVIEINDGNTILLDLSSRIPVELKRVIESTWENYRVVSVKKRERISSILERIINVTGVYNIKDVSQYREIGDTPSTKIFVEWLVSKKSQFEGAGSYAFNFVSEPSRLLPSPVRVYADKNGLEIIEIMDGLGIAEDGEKYQPCAMQALDSRDGVSLADSLLKMLGYSPVKDSEANILSGEGLNLSIKVDLLLNIGGKRVIITSSRVSEQILNILRKRGDKVIFISENKDRKEIIENIMSAMNIPCLNDNFKFLLSGHNGKESGDISLSALRLGDDEILYLVDYDIDDGIYGLLNKEWKVTLVRY
ncbi:MAG: LysM peptidoglycan-binding domain-containing protein [Deltaproteobacteria bacterium]|nr:LysM peptidoglycan-binding domain-containing protein [Deltaproteobacteria bacterium]